MWPFRKTGYEAEFKSVSGSAVLVSYRGQSEAYEIPETYVVEPVTEIAAGAFKSASVKAVYAGANIKKIGKKAFAGCHADVSVIIPEIAGRAEGALIGCKSVYYESQEGLTLVSYSGHEENITLESSCFSKKVVKLGDRLFRMFAYLKSIKLPESLVSIGQECFLGCDDLTRIDFPPTLAEIGKGAFSKAGFTSVLLPARLEKVGDYAFLGCKNLESVSFSNPDTVIGAGAFAKCALTKIVLPEHLSEIQSEVFRENKRLSSIVLPKSVEAVWEYAFADSGLESISLPENTEIIGEGAFSGMTKLASADFSDKMREIGSGAFAFSDKLARIDTRNTAFSVTDGLLIDRKNRRLIAALPALVRESVTVPDGISEIGDYAFAGLKGVKKIVLPESVQSVGAWAMRDMGEIETLELMGNAPVFGENAFFGTDIHHLTGRDDAVSAVRKIISDIFI